MVQLLPFYLVKLCRIWTWLKAEWCTMLLTPPALAQNKLHASWILTIGTIGMGDEALPGDHGTAALCSQPALQLTGMWQWQILTPYNWLCTGTIGVIQLLGRVCTPDSCSPFPAEQRNFLWAKLGPWAASFTLYRWNLRLSGTTMKNPFLNVIFNYSIT